MQIEFNQTPKTKLQQLCDFLTSEIIKVRKRLIRTERKGNDPIPLLKKFQILIDLRKDVYKKIESFPAIKEAANGDRKI